MSNAARWGLVTFCVGITCGVLGHFLSMFPAAVTVLGGAIIGAMIGTFSIENEK